MKQYLIKLMMANASKWLTMLVSKVGKQTAVFCIDAVLIASAVLLSYSLRFNTIDLQAHGKQILMIIPLMLVLRLGVFIVMGLYRGLWRFVGMRDLLTVIQAVTLGSLLAVGLLFLVFRLEQYPRSVFVIDWFVTIVFIGGSRFAYRMYREGSSTSARSAGSADGKRVLIVGAGREGELLIREICGDYRMTYQPVGFVDDDRNKRNMSIHGYRVLGNTREIPRIVKQYGVKEVFFTISSASGAAKRRIMLTCKRAGVKSKALPGSWNILNGNVTVRTLRDFRIEDLLGRESVRLDTGAIDDYLRGKTVMITGAGGSIGSDLCRQVLRFLPRRLVLFDQSEFNMYQIQMNLQERYPEAEVHPVIGDLLNQPRLERTMLRFKPEVVFHAAAYKHVPLMELNAEEALRNNAIGTWNAASLAVAHGVEKFVMVSTDKAVRPTNIMGASKRVAELICQGLSRKGGTKFVTVRFGNVLNSVGSVIPLFRRQIARGGPVTVTHPEIYRYFMTIREATQLILQAGAMGRGCEIFILDMGEPVKIVDLARDMISLSGFEPDKDIKIAFTGLRPGEKLYEELLTGGEEVKATLHEKIMVADSACIDWPTLLINIEMLMEALRNGFSGDVARMIQEIVPEFQPENGGPRRQAQHHRAVTVSTSPSPPF